MMVEKVPDTEHFRKLKSQALELPKSPGVYLMKAQDGELIYVGKARNLLSRVMSYFRGGDGRHQIQFLLRRVYFLEKIVTATEEQALILERDLINKYKPRYNIRLKDDKSYLSIRIDRNAEWPRIELVRKVEQDGALYFGPFTAGGKIRSILEIIKNVIPLRTCSNTVFYNRTRPCLEYQIKRCSGPCALPVDREDYLVWVDQAIALLQGKKTQAIENMKKRMEEASENLRFEEAAALRDKINLLEDYARGGAQSFHQAESRDCFGIFRQESRAVIYIIKVRNGRLADSDRFALENLFMPDEEVMEDLLLQYYEGQRDVPEEILVSCMPSSLAFIKRRLKAKRGEPVDIFKPARGSKLHVLKLANINAEQEFQTRFMQEEYLSKIVQEISEKFRLRQVPRRIECVDISNLQGSDIVGAVVSFFDGKPDKQNYRRYKISFQDKPDDFAAIGEVVNRRLKRGKDEADLPDLLIIDGGAQQLAKALEARDRLAVTLDIIALAKIRGGGNGGRDKPERVFLEGSETCIELDPAEAATHFLQRIRDEAHRFVIAFHRQKRSKRVFKSSLDEISGLGPERKGRLLRHFGDVSLIRSADLQELAKVGRMPLSLAKKVKEFLSNGRGR